MVPTRGGGGGGGGGAGGGGRRKEEEGGRRREKEGGRAGGRAGATKKQNLHQGVRKKIMGGAGSGPVFFLISGDWVVWGPPKYLELVSRLAASPRRRPPIDSYLSADDGSTYECFS